MTLPANVHPDEPGAVALLDQALTALANALDDMPIGDVVNIKAKIATIETATKQLGMSKEAQEYATEAVRRSEWALGRAIRRGQAEGTVRKQGQTDRWVDPAHVQEQPPAPLDFASHSEMYGNPSRGGGIVDMSNLDTSEFDEVIEDAKEQGNLSRANVARLSREKAGQAPKAKPRRPLPDVARDAGWDLRKSVERLERLAADDRFGSNKEQVATHLRSHLTNAIEVCQDLLDRINNN